MEPIEWSWSKETMFKLLLLWARWWLNCKKGVFDGNMNEFAKWDFDSAHLREVVCFTRCEDFVRFLVSKKTGQIAYFFLWKSDSSRSSASHASIKHIFEWNIFYLVESDFDSLHRKSRRAKLFKLVMIINSHFSFMKFPFQSNANFTDLKLPSGFLCH